MNDKYANSVATYSSHAYHGDANSIWASRVLLNEEIAARMNSGDSEALNLVLISLGTQLTRYVYTIYGGNADADDVVQEALATASLKLAQLRNPCHIKPWAYRIARNLVWMRLRKKAATQVQEVPLDESLSVRSQSRAGHIAGPELRPDRQTFWAEIRVALAKAVLELPPKYRTVVLLRDVEGASTAEAAEALDISTDNVKTRLHRAHAELRVRLAAYRDVCTTTDDATRTGISARPN